MFFLALYCAVRAIELVFTLGSRVYILGVSSRLSLGFFILFIFEALDSNIFCSLLKFCWILEGGGFIRLLRNQKRKSC